MLQLCAANDLPHEVRDLSLAEAYRAEEAFCTGTMGEIAAVEKIDGREVGTEAPGPVTRRLAGLFAELTAREGTQLVD